MRDNVKISNKKINPSAQHYCMDQFAYEIPVLDMPLDYLRSKEKNVRGITERILDERLSNELKKFLEENDVTSDIVYLSAVMILLHKYSRQDDIVIGKQVFINPNENLEDTFKNTVNYLPIRGKVKKDKSIEEFLKEMKQICLEAEENKEYSYEKLVEALGISSSGSKKSFV